jgi:hypothetical protein
MKVVATNCGSPASSIDFNRGSSSVVKTLLTSMRTSAAPRQRSGRGAQCHRVETATLHRPRQACRTRRWLEVRLRRGGWFRGERGQHRPACTDCAVGRGEHGVSLGPPLSGRLPVAQNHRAVRARCASWRPPTTSRCPSAARSKSSKPNLPTRTGHRSSRPCGHVRGRLCPAEKRNSDRPQ